MIDWRAPVSRPFYRASRADPMNLARRRRFGFSGGELTAFEDELFAADRSAEERQTKPGRARFSSTRSSGRGRGRCAISSRPSSPTRTISSGPEPRGRSACRARRVPGRPPSGCTGSPTCCTRTGSRCAGAGSSWSGRTGPSSPISATSCLRSASLTSPRRPLATWSGPFPSAGPTPRPPRSSRGTRGWRRYSGGRCGRRSGGHRNPWYCRAGRGAGGWPLTSSRSSPMSCAIGASGTARPASCSSTGSRT